MTVRLHSSLRNYTYFSGHEQQSNITLVKNKSYVVPPVQNDRHLTLCLENISNVYEKNPTPKQKRNVTSSQRMAHKNLEKDDSIIIKQADKTGITIVMDKSYYRDKMLEMFSDRETYIELDQN